MSSRFWKAAAVVLALVPLGCPAVLDDFTLLDARSDGSAVGAAGDVASEDGGAGADAGQSTGGTPPIAGSSSAGGRPAAGGNSSMGGVAVGGSLSSGGSMASGGSAGAMPQCGAPLLPTRAECPPACARCEAGRCIIECLGTDACKDGSVSCPDGLACTIVCEGTASCNNARLACSPDFDCNVQCSGTDACKDAELTCDGNCLLDCRAHEKVCEKTRLVCGRGRCGATCHGEVVAPNVACGQTCGCSPCSEESE